MDFKFDNFDALHKTFLQLKIGRLPFTICTISKPEVINGFTVQGMKRIHLFEDLLMQFFWSKYVVPFGVEFIKEQIPSLSSEIKELVECCISNLNDFVECQIDDFYAFLEDAYEEFDLTDFRNDIPVLHIGNVHRFIKRFYHTDRIHQWPILLAYWSYRMNFSDINNEEHQISMEKGLLNLRNRLIRDKRISDPQSFIRKGVSYANRILEGLGYLQFNDLPKLDKPMPVASVDAPLTGAFYLSPKYIRFMDGYVWLYHPKYPSGSDGHLPLRHEVKESRKVYSDISEYLVKKLPPIKVEARNGNIIKVLTPFMITECIDLIEHKSEKPSVSKEKVKPRMQRKDIIKSEAKTLIKEFKSRYLDYLCASQLDNFKVVCCIEQRTTESGASATEYSFIFTLKSTPRKTLLIFENVNNSRSTYAVSVDTSSYEDCVDNVFAYFASDILNKRQKMASGELRINHSGIRDMKRIFHKDYLTWCDAIKSLKYF